MNDDEVGSLIYDVLLVSLKALTEKEIHRELKNHHLTANQICQCLKLLHCQGLVCLNSTGAVDLWSLLSDDDVLSSTKDKGSPNGWQDTDDRLSPRRTSSSRDRCSPLSTGDSVRSSYAGVTQTRDRQSNEQPVIQTETGAQSSACSAGIPPVGQCYKRPGVTQTETGAQSSACSTGIPPVRQTPASKKESHPRGAVNHDPQSPMTETPKSTNRSRERTESPSEVAGALVAVKKEDTMATVNKTFGNMQLAVPADTRVALYSSLKPEAQQCYDGLQNILQVLKSAIGNIKPADIAKKAGLGDSRKSANKHLYFLEKKGMIKKSEESSSPLWRIMEKGKNLTDENMTDLAAEFYLRDNKSSKNAFLEIASCSQDSTQNGAANGECNNCRRPCVKIVNENHFHHHNYVCQVGNNNTVHVPPSSDEKPSVENG